MLQNKIIRNFNYLKFNYNHVKIIWMLIELIVKIVLLGEKQE